VQREKKPVGLACCHPQPDPVQLHGIPVIFASDHHGSPTTFIGHEVVVDFVAFLS
jgi:hypothetical protein